MKKLKIGLVFDDSLDKTDGVAQYVLILGEWLKSQGHDVHFLVGRTHRTDLANLHSLSRNIAVRFNKNRMSMPLPTSSRKLKTLLQREKFDILHVQMPYSPALAGKIIAAADVGTAIIGTFHILPHSKVVHSATRALGALQRRTLRRFDAVMSTSPPAATFAEQTLGVKSVVVPLGIPLERFFAAKPFGVYKNKRVIVTVGRLVQRKGCQYLLQAVALLKQNGKLPEDVLVVICGHGPLESRLKQFVQAQGLQHQVEFKGFVSEDDKPRFLASADIAIYPSTGGESFGIVLLEAMAASRGVVLGGDNPGYASVIGERPETLFDPKDIKAMAHKIASLLNDEPARMQARNWQKQHIKQFDIPKVGQKILNVYNEALQARTR